MKLLLIVLLLLTLSGCGLFSKKEPEKVYVTKVEYVKVNVPSPLRKNCVKTRPMSVNDYMSLTPIEREEYLTDYSIQLLGNLKDCEALHTGTILLIDQTNELYKDKSDERKPKD